MAWWNKQGIASPNLNVTTNQQQYLSGTDWRSQMQPMTAGWRNTNQPTMDSNYQDLIMNPEHMPNRLQNLERFDDNRFTGDTQKNMRLEGEPWLAENWTPKDIINKDTTLTGYQKFPKGDQWNNKDKYLRSDQYLDTLEPSLSGQNFDKRGFEFPNFGVLGLLKNMKDQFQYKGATEELWDPDTGQMISAEEQDKQNALGGYYSPAAKHARLQEKRVLRMLARQKAGKDIGEGNLARLQKLGYGPEEKIKEKITDTITAQGDQVNTGGGGGSQQTFRQTSPAGISQAQSRAARTDQRGNVMSGWGLAQGGRAGYAFGDRVEQETDFIQGPQGGEEFQETVVEGQEQPSREQLEALSMEIFQLPLDDLDDQQLLVVYQEAMQGQPMEEAVQEDEVQYAANGGLASLL